MKNKFFVTMLFSKNRETLASILQQLKSFIYPIKKTRNNARIMRPQWKQYQESFFKKFLAYTEDLQDFLEQFEFILFQIKGETDGRHWFLWLTLHRLDQVNYGYQAMVQGLNQYDFRYAVLRIISIWKPSTVTRKSIFSQTSCHL